MTDQDRGAGASGNGRSRREFLQTGAAVAGAAALFGVAGKAAARREDPVVKARPRVPLKDGEPVRMGVIGPGGMGTGHCHAFMNLTKGGHMNARIVAVADVNDLNAYNAKKILEEGQAGGGEVQTYRDYNELLSRDDIHAVLIASPEHWHAQMAIDAIAAGKDVYLEKPMTLNLDDALRLYKVVKANPDIILQVGTQMMQLPKYKAAQRLIAEGAIGDPTCSQTSYCRNSLKGEWLYYNIDSRWTPGENLDWDNWCGPLGQAPWNPEIYARWRRYKKYSTGIFGDLLVHVMTPLVMALDQGWPTRVVGAGAHISDKAMENPDQVNLIAEFETGHQMIVAGSTCNEVGLETLIRGHKANIYLGSDDCVLRPERIFAEDIDPLKIESERFELPNDQDRHRADWIKCIRERRQPESDVEMGLKIMIIVDLATRSMDDGHAYTFDPATMTAKRV
ncbi:MAG: Gfo/Idh/MocA family oxidoreductase [Phycisphaerales bacterium]|nr:Gfo/Idh/MocA family oxidoreductase [Phycisphaerales bacterium]